MVTTISMWQNFHINGFQMCFTNQNGYYRVSRSKGNARLQNLFFVRVTFENPNQSLAGPLCTY